MSFNVIRHKDIHQAHVIMGAAAPHAGHPDRHAFQLLNNILGGPAMTSRFNTALRERAGLVYTVESTYSAYPDAGLWQVYFGCDPHDAPRCRHLVERELKQIITTPLTPRQLRAAQQQYCGQIGIARSNRESYAISLGKTYALYGHVRSLDETFALIQAVTAPQLQTVAARWLNPEHLSTLTYAPHETSYPLPR